MKPLDVPAGFSPNLQNCRFRPRMVETRPGITQVNNPLAPAAAVRGIAEFIDGTGVKNTIFMDDLGVLELDAGANGVSGNPVVGSSLSLGPGVIIGPQDQPLMKSISAFGRIWTSFFSPLTPGTAHPAEPRGPVRHWDGILAAVPGGSVPPGACVPQSAAAAGAESAMDNGTYGVRIAWLYKNGAMSQASANATVVLAGGGKVINVTAIPTPAANNPDVVARIIICTRPNGSSFFYIPSISTSIDAGGLNSSSSVVNDITSTAQRIAFGPDANFQKWGFDVTGLTSAAFLPPLPHLSPDGPGTNFLGTANTFKAAVNAAAGSNTFGVHFASVVFKTRFGYLSQPMAVQNTSVNQQYSSAGGDSVDFTNIPVGPWYVVGRQILLTLSGGANFFAPARLSINDNFTTALIAFSISDLEIAQSLSADYLFRNAKQQQNSSGVGVYGGRLVTWGGLNVIQDFGFGFDFDGGWAADGVPNGWVAGASFAGGQKEMLDVFTGQAWKIVGDGATAKRGEIFTNSVSGLIVPTPPGVTQAINPSVLSSSVAYKVSFRAKRSSGLVAGTLHVRMSQGTGSDLVGGVDLAAGSLTTSWTEYNGTFTPGIANPSGINPLVHVFVDGTPTNGEFVIVDHIIIYPLLNPVEGGVIRFSNPYDVETFDGVNGFQTISKDDGQRIMNGQQLRSFFYVWKERSMHTLYDDGSNPPSLWYTRQVDGAIGMASPNASISTDTFILFAARAGAYIFAGGRPVKVSQEIQTTWERINWQASPTIHAILDPQRKRALFFVPLDSNPAPFNSFYLDYAEGMGEEDDPGGRKWGIDLWPQQINASLRFETPTSKQAIYLAGNNVYIHDEAATDDDGVAIDCFYDTAFLKAGDRGQDLFGGVVVNAEGTGNLVITLRGLDDVVVQTLNYKTNAFIPLGSSPGLQFEMYGNLESERAKVRFETNALGAKFTMKSLAVFAMPWSEARPL